MKLINNIAILATCCFFIIAIGCSSGQIEPTEGAANGNGTDSTDNTNGVDITGPALFSVTAVTTKSFFQLIIPWVGSPSVSALSLADFNCAQGDPGEILCDCPAGGTATSTLLDDSTLFTEEGVCSLGDGIGSIAIDMQFVTSFEDCAIEVCGSTVSLNGDVGTAAEGEVACEANPVVLLTGTDAELDCEEGAALTVSVDEEEVKDLIFLLEYDPYGDGFGGDLCTDDGLLPFDNLGDLLAALGEDLSCPAP